MTKKVDTYANSIHMKWVVSTRGRKINFWQNAENKAKKAFFA